MTDTPTTDEGKPSETYDGNDLEEARVWLRRRFQKGLVSECPCCNQTVKRYARAITPAMMAGFRVLAEAGSAGLTPPDVVKRSGNADRDYSKLAGWRFIEKIDGRWFITATGKAFLSGHAHAPKYTYWYNGTVVGASEERITIEDLREVKKFSLEETLSPETGTPTPETVAAP